MATIKRTSRAAGPGVTQRAVELYREGLPLVPIRDACVRSDEMCSHPECDRLHAIQRELDAELGLRPWHPSPLDKYGEPPLIPSDYGDAWEIVGPLKDALEAAQ